MRLSKSFWIPLVLIALYYLLFVNRGLVLFDEGYFVHNSERIFSGQIPYKDFFLQYSPGYFYLLVGFYKLFGVSILTGRILSYLLCLLIFGVSIFILKTLKVNSAWIWILCLSSIVIYGYPAINIPHNFWLSVLMSHLFVYFFLLWLNNKKSSILYPLATGLIISLSLLSRQNTGLVLVLLSNIFFLFAKKMRIEHKLKDLLISNSVWLLITFSWIYYFFLRDNIAGLNEFINYSRNFVEHSAFTIPSIRTVFESPFGIIKILPYYFPIVYALFVIKSLFEKKQNWDLLIVSSVTLLSFASTMYPQTDVLHIYPFFGPLLFSAILFFQKRKGSAYVQLVVIILLIGGIYLTLIKDSYRYEKPYNQQIYSLNLPKTQGIHVEKRYIESIPGLYNFIQTHTSKNDYIFAYPYQPLLYTILERKNPTRDAIYYSIWHVEPQKEIEKEILSHHTRYLVTIGDYKFSSSTFKQELVFQKGLAHVYQIILLK